MLRKHSAFTLIEILVVATIIIVLTTISIASFSTANKSARDAKRKSDLETIRQAMVLYKTQSATGVYPTGSYERIVTALIGGNFLSPPAPADPANGSDYSVDVTSTTAFCFCDLMDVNTRGNSGAACSFSATTHYCVRQP